MATTSGPPTETSTKEPIKPVHTIILDTSPILLNTPSISTLLANSHALVTTPSVLTEIKGEEARTRLETLYTPFLTIRSPQPESVKLVKDFARRTGDSSVLSPTDFEILALAYDLECERNGGDWRLRRNPGQKRLNGSPPGKEKDDKQDKTSEPPEREQAISIEQQVAQLSVAEEEDSTSSANQRDTSESIIASADDIHEDMSINLTTAPVGDEANIAPTVTDDPESSDSDGGWITPSNIKRHQAEDDAASNATKTETKTLQVATMTGDFAMQNVLLQMNLNLLSTKTCKRVAHIKQMIFRCHGCFCTTKDMSKQFCPRCGKPTLTRVTCTTNDKGEVKLHLKANHQWNNRGNVFSIPKPTAGTANQKWKGPRQGGGHGGWGNELILAEDQKEYVRAMSSTKRTKNKDLMDEDMLPSILTGARDRSGGRIKVGGGRNINSRKR